MALDAGFAQEDDDIFVCGIEHIKKLILAKPDKEWVGLTDEDKNQIAMEANNKSEMTAWEYAQRVGEFTEGKLKEKNT